MNQDVSGVDGMLSAIDDETRRMQASRVLTGRQIWWLIQKDFEIAKLDGQGVEWETLINCSLVNHSLHRFMADWENVLQGLTTQPDEEHLEYFFRRQLDQSYQLKDMMLCYKTQC